MRTLCILFLATCAAIPYARAACLKCFTDAEPAQPLRPTQPQTWAQLEAGCAAGYPGRTLLQFVDSLSEEERAACGEEYVPFGVYETNRLGLDWPPITFHWSGGEQIVAVEDLVNLTYVPHGTTEGVAVIELATGRWTFVSQTQTFECALCQMARVAQIRRFAANSLPDNVTFLSTIKRQVVFEIVLVGGVRDGDRIASDSTQNVSSPEEELGKLFGVTQDKIELSRAAINDQGLKEINFYLTSDSMDDFHPVAGKASSVLGQTLTVGQGARYEVREARRVSPCPVEDFPEGYQPVVKELVSGSEVLDPKIFTFGEIQVLVDVERELLSQRECVWNDTLESLSWTQRCYWRVQWKNCSAAQQAKEDKIVQTELKAILARRAEKKLDGLPRTLNCTGLEEVAELVNYIVTKNNNVSEVILEALSLRLAQTTIDADSDFCLVDKSSLQLVVSNLTVTSHVVGLKLDLAPKPQHHIADRSLQIYGDSTYGQHILTGPQYLGLSGIGNPSEYPNIEPTSPDDFTASPELKNSEPQENTKRELDWEVNNRQCQAVRAGLNATDMTTEFTVVIGEGLSKEFEKLTLALVALKVFSSNGHSATVAFERTAYIELSTDLELSNLDLDDDDYYIDIAYPFVKDTVEKDGEIFYTSCVSWNRWTENWSKMACRKRKGLQDSLAVCRCRAKHMTQNGGVLKGIFALRKAIDSMTNTDVDSSKDDIFQYATSNAVLISFTVLECVISSAGLLSFILTAICYRQWREDVGHKILLQMVMAITMNLAFGFVTDYVHLDTEGVGCIAIGVLRHYSFLAMFLWMLVLSGLQMKRLMTVAGAKATSHLVLKVALFAWGVPLFPIVVLLAWNARIYRSDRYDRGYCYPEGLFFRVTVQVPAALILFVNLLIFVAILRHIFECCSGEKITKHSKNERAQQMRRVATSVFIFFLFGFTWVLHYLSEERLIKSDFLFEYLFLMTATTHISVLALFFVILDDKARGFWLEAIKDKFCFGREAAGKSLSSINQYIAKHAGDSQE